MVQLPNPPPAPKTMRTGLIILGVFIAGMITMAGFGYVVVVQGGKMATKMLSDKLVSSVGGVPGAGSVTGIVPSGGLSPDLMKQLMTMASQGGGAQSPEALAKMMDQLPPEGRAMVAKMLPGPDQLASQDPDPGPGAGQ